jgi:thymidylate synthase
MASSYLRGETLDDVMRLVIEAIQSHGERINPSKGGCTELTGVLIELENPRARLSRTETRGKLFSSLGELCWYLSKTNDLEFISYYIPHYCDYADGNILYGGYGPRLFNMEGVDQVANIIALLRKKPDSRKAVIQLFSGNDIVNEHNDVPCTCTIQFMIRRNELQMLTSMRSNDVIIGLSHDIFCFTMLQEIIARALSVKLGNYKHVVGSLHIYDNDKNIGQQFLDEGWQSTDILMPPMPEGDPWSSINVLLKAESVLRVEGSFDIDSVKDLDPYWVDLIQLLQVYRYSKDGNVTQLKELQGKLSSSVYNSFIFKKLNQLSIRS